MRLYLDANDGIALVPCPQCGSPLVLGARKMGRWLVGYRGGFVVRPGSPAVLICSRYECDYQENADIAPSAKDAVVFNPLRAAGMSHVHQLAYTLTPRELQSELERLRRLHAETGNIKLPSAIKFLRERWDFLHYMIHHYLETSFEKGCQVVCDGKDNTVWGRVTALMGSAVAIQRAGTRETVLVNPEDVLRIAFCAAAPKKRRRCDFGEPNLSSRHRALWTPRRYVVIGGFSLSLGGSTRSGMCQVQTDDPVAGAVLGMSAIREDVFFGEFPVWAVERCYLRLRYCTVQGHRLYFLARTQDPDVVQLGTRSLEAAEALHMHLGMHFVGQRKALRWLRFFNRGEISGEEEREVPLRLALRRR